MLQLPERGQTEHGELQERVSLVLLLSTHLPGCPGHPLAAAQVLTTLGSRLSASLAKTRLLHAGQANVVRGSVLRQMCLSAAQRVDVTKTFKQFAVFLLHRDDFDETPRWYSGDAQVSAGVAMDSTGRGTKVQWYTHGLPMWPLPFQAIDNTTSKWPHKKKKPANWPNYGLATPLYLAAKGLEGTDLNSSFPCLFLSQTQRNKGLCPDEMYIYLRFTPCYPIEPSQVVCYLAERHARLLLTASCPTTTVIVGYSKRERGHHPPVTTPVHPRLLQETQAFQGHQNPQKPMMRGL
ncbi:hypothetical protein GWK47_005077 [Chionoecetes opilio]|uniref:Uncharacterized protein n=1 Tax=Chionoecetes opilio TaxID=41210 RepID=A0A8J5CL57_CHIOP|nr:hypothetical protein GWK47_005077 [Chionoecetes opilio]